MTEKVQINIQLEKETKDEIKILCAKKGITISDLIRNYLENYVKRNKELL